LAFLIVLTSTKGVTRDLVFP